MRKRILAACLAFMLVWNMAGGALAAEMTGGAGTETAEEAQPAVPQGEKEAVQAETDKDTHKNAAEDAPAAEETKGTGEHTPADRDVVVTESRSDSSADPADSGTAIGQDGDDTVEASDTGENRTAGVDGKQDTLDATGEAADADGEPDTADAAAVTENAANDDKDPAADSTEENSTEENSAEKNSMEKDPAEENSMEEDPAEGEADPTAVAEDPEETVDEGTGSSGGKADESKEEDVTAAPAETVPETVDPMKAGEGQPIPLIDMYVSNPVCMETADPKDSDHEYGMPYVFVGEDEDLEIDLAETTFIDWAVSCGSDSYEPYRGTFVGDETYRMYVVMTPVEGFYFDENTLVKVSDDNYEVEDSASVRILGVERECLKVEITLPAQHRWSSDITWIREPTCEEAGLGTRICEKNDTHTMTEVVEDPDAHVWGEWKVIEEATTTKEGKKKHTCTLCGSEESEVIPKVTIPYTKVYEPDTSWSMAATIAWRADQNAGAAADPSAAVRPATVFVWLDKDLKVYDRDGNLLSEDFESFVKKMSEGVIPAFYISDEETAAALKEAIIQMGLQDCFVVSDSANKEIVKDVADLLHVRGMLDFTSVTSADRKALAEMIAAVNGAHGKVVILSPEAATRENIRTLQSLAATVWVQVPADVDTKTLVTLYTNGVDGIIVDDYEKAISAEELFQDDAPSLLRVPLVIGHRGDPSSYVENTLDSAEGAYGEGVDSVENDIHLTTDGRLVIYHDDIYGSLTNIPYDERKYIEDMSLEELQSLPFSWETIPEHNEVPADQSRDGTLYGQDEQKEYTVPTLDEYLERFKNTGLVHDTEIKSGNTAILQALKGLVDAFDAWDQIFCISFEKAIIEAIYRDYPEIPIGALTITMVFDEEAVEAYNRLENKDDPEALLAILYSQLDKGNATYNPFYYDYGQEMVKAGRHRGLTVWPWTYTYGEEFARDYMGGVRGMTMDYPWITTDFIVSVSSPGDVTIEKESDIEKPYGTTRGGEQKILEDAELVTLETLSETQTLRIWRYRADMEVKGENYGYYYLYSNPFAVTVAAHEHDWGEPSYEWSSDNGTVRAARVCSSCGGSETETVKTTEEIVREPADGQDGEKIFTAVFTNPAFATQTKSVPIPASGETQESEEKVITYRCTEGDGNVWKRGSSITCDFKFRRSEADQETLAHFTGILVDGDPVDPADYKAEPGSVLVRLQPDFLEGLEDGEHELTAEFDDGNDPSARFRIVSADEEDPDPEDEKTEDEEEKDEEKENEEFSPVTDREDDQNRETAEDNGTGDSTEKSSKSSSGRKSGSSGSSSGGSGSSSSGSSGSRSSGAAPATGDESGGLFWLLIAGAAAAGFAVTLAFRRRKY